jgi:hypothetical protein
MEFGCLILIGKKTILTKVGFLPAWETPQKE